MSLTVKAVDVTKGRKDADPTRAVTGGSGANGLKEMSAKKQLQNHSVTYTFYVKFPGFEANFSKIYQYIWELRDNGVVKNLQF